MTRATRFLFIVALASILAACNGARTITATELARIMPSAADAPMGTGLRAAQVGPKTLDQFVDDAAVRAKLLSLGFDIAYTASFATPSFPPDASTAPPGSALYATFGVLLKDAKTGARGFAYYAARSRARARHLTVVLAQNLGDDSFAFHFSSLDNSPLPGAAYLWRVGNALFSVVGIGNPSPDPAAVRSLVHVIDARAER